MRVRKEIAAVTDEELLSIAGDGKKRSDPLMYGVQTTWEDVKTLSYQDLAANLWYFRQYAEARHGWSSSLRQLEREWIRRAAEPCD